MKRLITILAALLLLADIFAQAPEKISYQAIIRNSSNALVANTQIGMQISILQGLSTTVVYKETHSPITNANGLVSLEIGNGSAKSGDFSTINWANGPYFIKTETDLAGGINYTIIGISQLLSVPYALYAKTAGTVTHSESYYYPQSGRKGDSVLVSFSGGSNVNFSQASPIALKFQQASPIYPDQIRYINSKKIDVNIKIPWNAATGTYDIIINPNDLNPNIIERAFLIDMF